jgi:hypothetical protein
MEKIEISDETSYMDFVLKFHKAMQSRRIKLVYEGEINQSLTKAFAALTEKKLEDGKEDLSTTKKVYHVMVECLQNICKHSDDSQKDNEGLVGHGIFIIDEEDSSYSITTGNIVSKEKYESVKATLDSINALTKEEIKAAYVKQMKEGRLSDKGGAGLGFLDMAKKTGNKFQYHLENLGEDKHFFIFKTIISKN